MPWNRLQQGQLDQPPAQTWVGFRITSEPLQVDIYKLQEQVHGLLEYVSLGLPTLLAKKLGFALLFKPSHEQVGDINYILSHYLVSRLNKHGSYSVGCPWLGSLQFVTLHGLVIPNLPAAVQIWPHEHHVEGYIFTSQWNLHHPSACGVGIAHQWPAPRIQFASLTDVRNLGLKEEMVLYSSSAPSVTPLYNSLASTASLGWGTLCKRSVEESRDQGSRCPSSTAMLCS